MNESISTHVGLDVHKDTTEIAVAGPDSGRARFMGTVGLPESELLKVLAKLGEASAMRIVYEAGVTVPRSQG